MYSIFNIKSNNTNSLGNVRYLSDVRNSSKRDLNTVIDKNNRYPYYVPSNHILSQYLQSISVEIDINLDDFTYYSDIKSKALYHASNYGITTSINTGVIHSGSMYGNGRDILIGYTGVHNPKDIATKWEYLSPIKVLRHNYKNYDIQPIVKLDKGYNNSINVFLIDLVLLLFQYRGYMIRAISNREISGIENDTLSKLLSRYTLNNLLLSHLDVCLLNNIYSTIINTTIDREKIVSTTVSVNNSQLEYIRSDIYAILKNRGHDIARVLSSIPTISSNVSQFLDLSNIPIARQNVWGYVYAFLPHLYYSLSVGSINSNRSNISSIKNTINRFKNDNLWSIQGISSIRSTIENELLAIEDLL